MSLAMAAGMPRLARLALVAASLVACADSPSYDEQWGADDIITGKADGLLDGAEILDFGESGTGFVEDQQMDVYAIDLREGDQITATLNVTSGDLSPHFTLYYGGFTHISSQTFTRETKKIVKTYTIGTTGRFYVSVRAYQNVGAGHYAFDIACNGGPCAGQPYVRPLTFEQEAECIGAARRCSFAALPQYSGAVGAVRARQIFEGCLDAAKTYEEHAECDSACSGEGKDLCDAEIAALPFYADQSGACITALEECLDVCFDIGGGGDAEDISDMPEYMCWELGFNGTCDTYSRGHVACGGTYDYDTREQCYAFCESTDGVWHDDLDTLCAEACD